MTPSRIVFAVLIALQAAMLSIQTASNLHLSPLVLALLNSASIGIVAFMGSVKESMPQFVARKSGRPPPMGKFLYREREDDDQ